VSLQSAEAIGQSLGDECGFQLLGGQTEGGIHQGSTVRFDRSSEELTVCISGPVKQFSLLHIDFLNRVHPTLGLDPFQDKLQNIDGECGCRVEQAVLVDMSGILEQGWNIVPALGGKIVTDDDNGHPRRSQILLRPGIDEAELAQIELPGEDIT